MDLSLRLKAAGWRLVYEPLARARHLRSDRLHAVLRNFWNWYHPPLQDRGNYESLAHAAACVPVQRGLATERINTAISQGRMELLYPTFLLFFWCCLRDLHQVLRRGKASPEAVSQTGSGVISLIRQQLRDCPNISGRVVERTLTDLQAGLVPLGSKEAPVDGASVEQQLILLREALPLAEHRYLEAFAREPYLSLFGPAQGAILDFALQALEAEEPHHANVYSGPANWILFNPPGDAARRWLAPSRIRALAKRLRDLGHAVHVIDAAGRLDESEAFERVLGLEPAFVVFSGAEGGLDRITAAARRLKLVEQAKARLVLVWAADSHPPARREELPMFDEVHAGLPW
jgi:hypothetical protein